MEGGRNLGEVDNGKPATSHGERLKQAVQDALRGNWVKLAGSGNPSEAYLIDRNRLYDGVSDVEDEEREPVDAAGTPESAGVPPWNSSATHSRTARTKAWPRIE